MSRTIPRRLGVGRVLGITGIAIILLHTMVAGLVVSLVVSTSVRKWEARIGAVIRDDLSEELLRVVGIRETLSGDDARDALDRRIDRSRFAVVINSDGRLIYWYVGGASWVDRGIPAGPASYEEARLRLQRLLSMHRLDGMTLTVSEGRTIESLLQESAMAVPVETYDGRRYGTLVAGSLELATDRTTREILRSAFAGFGLAVAVAAGAGVVALAIFARGAERATATLETTLRTLAEGNYRMEVPRFRVLQLDRISESAAELARALDREHELRRRWAGDIAHDLRTPVTALRAQLTGIGDGVLQPTPERLERLNHQLSVMESLVEDFLLLTKLEAPEFRPDREPIHPATLVESVSNRFSDSLERTGRSLQVTITPDLPICLMDLRLLERALANLVDNASKHGSGPVEISAVREDEILRLTVRNQGEIDPSIADHLLERSVRGEGAGSGHGLGLSIARLIADAHGGSLAVKSAGGMVEATLRVPFDS